MRSNKNARHSRSLTAHPFVRVTVNSVIEAQLCLYHSSFSFTLFIFFFPSVSFYYFSFFFVFLHSTLQSRSRILSRYSCIVNVAKPHHRVNQIFANVLSTSYCDLCPKKEKSSQLLNVLNTILRLRHVDNEQYQLYLYVYMCIEVYV